MKLEIAVDEIYTLKLHMGRFGWGVCVLRCYAIVSHRHPQLWASLVQQSVLHRIDLERMPGVETDAYDGAFFESWRGAGGGEALSHPDIARLLSHRMVWARLLKSGAPAAAVVEDEVEFGPAFGDFVKSHSWMPDDADIVVLSEVDGLSRGTSGTAFGRRLRIVGPASCGPVAYVLRRAAADRLLFATEKLDGTLEGLIFGRSGFARPHRVYGLAPAVCRNKGGAAPARPGVSLLARTAFAMAGFRRVSIGYRA